MPVSCHDQVHAILTEKQLERDWNTVEKLKSHPEMQKFAVWIKTKHNDKVATPKVLDI